MKKMILILAILLSGCSVERPVIDEDQFKNDLNSTIVEFQTELGIKKKDMYIIN